LLHSAWQQETKRLLYQLLHLVFTCMDTILPLNVVKHCAIFIVVIVFYTVY